MEATVKKEDIVSALNTTLGVIEKKQTMPILANVLIEVDESSLKLTATNLIAEVTTSCPILSCNSTGKTTVSAKKLNELCRLTADGQEINISLNKDKIDVKTNVGKYSLSTLPSADFPVFGDGGDNTLLSISSSDLGDLIFRTAFAVDPAHNWKEYLMGLYLFAGNGELVAVGYDSIRAAFAKKAINSDHSFSGSVPKKSINEISRFLSDNTGNAEFTITQSSILFSIGNIAFKSKLIERQKDLIKFFQGASPSGDCSVLECNVKELSQTVSRMSVLAADNKFNEILINASKDGTKISAKTRLSEQAEEHINATLNGKDFDLMISFSILQEALSHFKTDICHINFFGPNKIALISLPPPNTEEQQYLVQPIQPIDTSVDERPPNEQP